MESEQPPNGEKRILWRFVNILIAVCATGALLLGSLNAWAIRDYLDFKGRYAQDQIEQRGRDASQKMREAEREERQRWQESALQAIARKLRIPMPPPPSRGEGS